MEEKPIIRMAPEELDSIAQEVSKILITKAALWLWLHAIALVMIIVAGVSAWWQLNARVDLNMTTNNMQEERWRVLLSDNASFRVTVDSKLDRVFDKVDEINRYLRDNTIRPKPRIE